MRLLVRGSGAVFAVVVLLWMSVEIWCVTDKTTSAEENRTLERFPRLTMALEREYDFGLRFERWFADHFRRRKSMVRLSNKLRLRGNALVRQGREGWLYGVVLGAPEVFTHADRFDEAELETVRRRTAEYGRRAKAAGVGRVYFAFSNDKESICPEFYPSGYAKVHPESRLDQVWNALQGVSPDVTLVRFTDKLMAAKERTEVFCRSGTHLNNLADFLVYGWLADRIAVDFPTFAKVESAACRFGRDARHADKDLLRLGAVPFYAKKYLESDYAELRSPTAEVTLQEDRREELLRCVCHMKNARVGNDLKVFLLTDSFGRRWSPYLAESASETHVVFIGNDDPFVLGEKERRELLEMKPDILIVNFTERFLQRLLTLEFPKEVR